MKEQEALVVLNAVPGLGAGKIRILAEYFGSFAAVLEASYQDILASGFAAPLTAENIVHFSKDKFLFDEYNLVRQKGVRIITAADGEFPQMLRTIPGAPVVLYVRGKVELLHTACVAIVGSRVSSYYGQSCAKRFASFFAQAGVTVVSGMARGIDTASHQGCLQAGGATIAVVGCGLEHVYPKENRMLMEEIGQKGAVLSEMPMNAPPVAANFPRRNRIISGLTLAIVVIEAGMKSGALITADFALEQGRDVFAVPANIDYTTALGSNRLIKDGAKVALAPQDVLEEFKEQLRLVFPGALGKEHADHVSLTDLEMKFYRCLTTEPMHIDELSARVKQPAQEAAQVMLNLEIKSIVRKLPGKYYVKI